ncbi:hypothetical protein L873DRAFT_332312 [Choiromyces venosus 120613-1]|uniref:Uncharacterized protein n=1 Tax=Choiromyces venosus 120613-1 TaxID=1336337 RepID=A0A3N4K1C2_9PEZI|nr:hypothetical protein L873DRAFT_577766 [Choiromyces venosus 120613-1]RPB03002.1 hypothetical protein L873DRAFT_332312 [Choiromyces venosus 120613-1]
MKIEWDVGYQVYAVICLLLFSSLLKFKLNNYPRSFACGKNKTISTSCIIFRECHQFGPKQPFASIGCSKKPVKS